MCNVLKECIFPDQEIDSEHRIVDLPVLMCDITKNGKFAFVIDGMPENWKCTVSNQRIGIIFEIPFIYLMEKEKKAIRERD